MIDVIVKEVLVPEGNVDYFCLGMLSRHADNFRPDILSPEALEATLRTIRDEGTTPPLSSWQPQCCGGRTAEAGALSKAHVYGSCSTR